MGNRGRRPERPARRTHSGRGIVGARRVGLLEQRVVDAGDRVAAEAPRDLFDRERRVGHVVELGRAVGPLRCPEPLAAVRRIEEPRRLVVVGPPQADAARSRSARPPRPPGSLPDTLDRRTRCRGRTTTAGQGPTRCKTRSPRPSPGSRAGGVSRESSFPMGGSWDWADSLDRRRKVHDPRSGCRRSHGEAGGLHPSRPPYGEGDSLHARFALAENQGCVAGKVIVPAGWSHRASGPRPVDGDGLAQAEVKCGHRRRTGSRRRGGRHRSASGPRR